MRPLLVAAALWFGVSSLPADARGADLCAEATRAVQPAAPNDNPLAASARGVWQRVYGVFYAATGRQTELQVLGDQARMSNGQPFPPHAFICPRRGAAPRIHITYSLLQLIQKANRYDRNFLAMVLGHELGHRINDFDWQGRVTARNRGKQLETNADARGAFFAAAAGFRTRQLACDDVMNLFLNVEAGLDADTRDTRKGRLADVLRSFDVYESLYEAASVYAFWHTAKAKKLLGWIGFMMETRVEPIPEFKVLEALTLMMDAVGDAPWQDIVKTPGASPNDVRCTPVFPAHTAFWDEVIASEFSRHGTRGTGHPDLKKATKLLGEAIQMGASELAANSTLACVHFYQGEFDQAERALKKARGFINDDAPATLTRALDGNAALIAWGRWMQSNPAPGADAAAPDKQAWGKALARAGGSFKGHSQLAAWLSRVTRYPTVKPLPARRAGIGDYCPQGVPPVDYSAGSTMMTPVPAAPAAGGCPCGWSELHRIDDPVSKQRGAGVISCVPAGWGIGMRYVDINLPTTGVDARLLMVDQPRGPLESLAAWDKHCKRFEKRGISDAGEQVFAGSCKEVGAPRVVVVADRGCRVRRAVMVGGKRRR